MDLEKTKAVLDAIFDYWHKTIGGAIVIAAFWGLYGGLITEKTFGIMIAAVVSLKWVWKPAKSGWVDTFKSVLKSAVSAYKSIKK